MGDYDLEKNFITKITMSHQSDKVHANKQEGYHVNKKVKIVFWHSLRK